MKKKPVTDAADRDAAIDRLLAETLKVQADTTGPGCLDADTVAAWADGTLDSSARTSALAHAASCARCQALLAMMVKSAPAPAAASWWRSPFALLIPATVAAAAVVLFVAVPRRQPLTSAPVATAAQVSSPAASLEPPQPPAAAIAEPPAVSDRVTPPAQARERRAPARPASPARDASANASKPLEKVEADAKSAPPAAAPPPPAAPSAPATEALAAPPVAPQPAAGAGASAPPIAANSDATVGALARREERAFRAAQLAAPAASRVVVSSNPQIRWRIGVAGAVERSSDGGSTWETQQTGALVTLVAGAAPSPTICWMVGPAGTIVRTIDGRTWRLIAFPEAVSLVSVRATDDKSATVTTSDGRAFTTSDGGATWTPR
jgi:hypothetical protein